MRKRYGPFDKWSKSLAFHARVGGFESPRGHHRSPIPPRVKFSKWDGSLISKSTCR